MNTKYGSVLNDSDEIADIEFLNQQNSHLRMKNEQYIETIASMRKQLDQALDFAEQNNLLQQENRNLLTEIRKLNSEKEDVENRLNILTKKVEDINDKEQTKDSKFSLARQIEFKKKIEDLQFQLQASNQENAQLKNSIHELTQKNQSTFRKLTESTSEVIEAGKIFFGDNINNLEQLIDLLLNPPESKSFSVKSDNSEYIKKLEHQNAKYKHALTKLADACNSCDKKRAELENDLEKCQAIIDQERIKYEAKIREERHKSDILQIKLQNSEQTSESQINNLRSLLEEARSKQNKCQKSKIECDEEKQCDKDISHQFNTQIEKIKELSNSLSDSKNKIVSQDAIIQSLERSLGTINHKLKTITEERDDANKHLNEQKNLTNEVERKLSEKDQKINEIERNLQKFIEMNKELTQKAESAQQESNKSKDSIKLLEDLLKQQKEEERCLCKERDRLLSLVQKMNFVIAANDASIDSLQSDLRSVNSKLQRALEVKPVEQKVESLPPTAFFHTDFPRELINAISDFAQNSALTDSVKLRNTLGVIAHYYNSKIADLSEDLDKISSSEGELRRDYEEIINHLSKALNLSTDTSKDSIYKALGSILRSSEDGFASAAALNRDLNSILVRLEVSSAADAIDKLERLESIVENATSENRAMYGMLRKARKNIVKLQDERQSALSAVASIQKKSNEQKTVLEKQISELQNNLHQSQSELAKLKCEMESERIAYGMELERATMEREGSTEDAQKQFSKIKAQAAKSAAEHEMALNEAHSKTKSLEIRITELEATIEALVQDKRQLCADVDSMREAVEEANRRCKLQTAEAAQTAAKQHAAIESELKARNDELIALHAKAVNALKESEKRCRQLNNQLADTEAALSRVTLKADADAEAAERAQRIVETKSKAAVIAAEISAQAAAAEARSKIDDAVRKALSDTASELHHFVDASQPLIPETVQAAAAAARCELERLRSSDAAIRRILGISQDESAEQALSKLLVSLYNK